MARSRSPLLVLASGAFGSACAWFYVSQLPRRTPLETTPLARSGGSSALSGSSIVGFPHCGGSLYCDRA